MKGQVILHIQIAYYSEVAFQIFAPICEIVIQNNRKYEILFKEPI